MALLVHATALLAARPTKIEAEDPSVRREAVRRERAAILRTVEGDVASGRTTLGEALVRLGWLDHAEEDLALDSAERERAIATYRAMLDDVRARVARGEAIAQAIVAAVERDGRAGRYKRIHPRLADALARGGGNCVAISTLAASLAYDAGRRDASMRVYYNHVAPEVDGFSFGMVARCHGAGVRVDARDLLNAYGTARATGDTEPFTFPKTDDVCDDPGDVFREVTLSATDAPPLPALPPYPGGPRARLAAIAAASAPDENTCRRRNIMEEYDGDVEALGPDGRTLGGVGFAAAGALDLEGHASSAACFERRLAALPEHADAEPLVLALGDAAMAAEAAARVFAQAGEIDVAREYDRRLAEHRARAGAPLERVIGALGDTGADAGAAVAGAGRLVALGEGGRTAMLLASERHRGYWELANLMTRPSSQLGAIRRWGDKPIDVQLDVVDTLPCASETFLAQLGEAPIPEARRLERACKARARVEQLAQRRPSESDVACALDRAIAAERGDDLAEAIVVRRLAARCRTPEFVADAKRWAASKSEATAYAVERRLAASVEPR
ncbi:MAG: hypothetical protein KF819_12170 [Labilithrix sp.]|nr:hypothetical protein [Labilithrix sp.]